MESHLRPVKADYEEVFGKPLADSFDVDTELGKGLRLLITGYLTQLIGATNVALILAAPTDDDLGPVLSNYAALAKYYLAASALANWFRVGNIQASQSGPVIAASNGSQLSDDNRAEAYRQMSSIAKTFAGQLSLARSNEIASPCATIPVGIGEPTVTIISADPRSIFDREL